MAATNLHNYSVQEKLNKMDVDVITVTPTIETSAIDQHDVLFDYIEIPNAVSVNGGSAIIQSIQLLDEGDQGGAIDLVFQSDNTALGTLDAAVSISDANARDILGYVSITNYFDGIAWQMSTKNNIGLVVKAASDTKSIYVAGVIRSASIDYNAATDIQLKIGIVKD
tara:strand:- start:652 stop:1152 length:501 start_codon:yes stop_codon:yes gene_type:complete